MTSHTISLILLFVSHSMKKRMLFFARLLSISMMNTTVYTLQLYNGLGTYTENCDGIKKIYKILTLKNRFEKWKFMLFSCAMMSPNPFLWYELRIFLHAMFAVDKLNADKQCVRFTQVYMYIHHLYLYHYKRSGNTSTFRFHMLLLFSKSMWSSFSMGQNTRKI